MRWADFNQCMEDAKTTMRQAEVATEQLAELLIGRLRRCAPSTLKVLKRELVAFDSRSGEWKK